MEKRLKSLFKKRNGKLIQLPALLLLICLWASLSAFISAPRSTVAYLYECGEWAGEVCGTYRGALSNQIPSGSGTLGFEHGGTYTGKFLYGHPAGTGTYTFANGKCVSGSFTWSTGTDYVMEKSTTGHTPHYNGTDMVYVGMMKNGQPCSFGELDFQDGGTFYGEFLDGTVQGKGVYVYREPDSTTEVTGSDWSMVNRVPSSLGGRWYSGLVSGSTWQGYGMLCYNYSLLHRRGGGQLLPRPRHLLAVEPERRPQRHPDPKGLWSLQCRRAGI